MNSDDIRASIEAQGMNQTHASAPVVDTHWKALLAGYREYVINREPQSPFQVGSMSDRSWLAGRSMAERDAHFVENYGSNPDGTRRAPQHGKQKLYFLTVTKASVQTSPQGIHIDFEAISSDYDMLAHLQTMFAQMRGSRGTTHLALVVTEETAAQLPPEAQKKLQPLIELE